MNQLNRTNEYIAGNLVSCALIDVSFAIELLNDFTESHLGGCNFDDFVSILKNNPDLIDAKMTAIWKFLTSAKDKLSETEKIIWGDGEAKPEAPKEAV